MKTKEFDSLKKRLSQASACKESIDHLQATLIQLEAAGVNLHVESDSSRDNFLQCNFAGKRIDIGIEDSEIEYVKRVLIDLVRVRLAVTSAAFEAA